jgi:5'-deoxynucleotidase YfbR-like HD superfamily hydrolase
MTMSRPLTITEDVRLEASIRTYSGKVFHPFRPRAGEIDIVDIAHGLTLTKWSCRFRGQIGHWYSVAQHSVEVAKVIRRRGGSALAGLAGLVHDGSEAYLPDLAAPIKVHLKEYQDVEDTIQRAIYAYFLGKEPGEAILREVHAADMIMRATEAFDLYPPEADWSEMKGVPRLRDWRGPLATAEAVEKEFLALFEELQDAWMMERV